MATINVLDSVGATVAVARVADTGRAAATASLPTVMSTEDKTALDAAVTDLAAIEVLLTTQNGYLDGVEGLLTTIDTDTGASSSALGAVGDTAVTNPASSASVIAALKGLLDLIGDTNTQLPSALVGTMLSTVGTIRGDQIYAGAALTPKFAAISASSSGNNALVAAVTSKKIRVLAYSLVPNGAVNARFQTDGGGTPGNLTGLKYMGAAGNGIVQGFNPIGWFETDAGESLDLNLSGAVAVGGELVYVEV